MCLLVGLLGNLAAAANAPPPQPAAAAQPAAAQPAHTNPSSRPLPHTFMRSRIGSSATTHNPAWTSHSFRPTHLHAQQDRFVPCLVIEVGAALQQQQQGRMNDGLSLAAINYLIPSPHPAQVLHLTIPAQP